jgi:hypothetical protein
MKSATSPSPADEARESFARERLPLPPLHEHLAARLAAAADRVFASRQLAYGPYSLGPFLHELETGDPGEYAVVGFDGHGMNSWAAHYYLVQPGLALFLQLPWGGAYHDPAEGPDGDEVPRDEAARRLRRGDCGRLASDRTRERRPGLSPNGRRSRRGLGTGSAGGIRIERAGPRRRAL